jgi:small subunit ribosomal protein S6
LRDYEVLYIVRADFDDDKVQDAVRRVNTLIERSGGSPDRTNLWGKRKLAYEVKKQLKGIYIFFSYLGSPGLVEELERNLRLTDSVIRYYSVKIAENVDPAARPSEFTEEAFAKAATPGPDEEEIATGQANVRSPFAEEEEGAFDFEEAVFGGVDEPARKRED